MPRYFSKLWQQQEDSDIDVVVLLAPAAAAVELGQQEQQRDPDRPARLELARFPAHSFLLKDSPVLQCKVQRWQGEAPSAGPALKRAKRSKSNNSSSVEAAPRRRLELELQDASELAAALAVLQSLYEVKPLPELLSELSQEQQLQAAVLADMWQVPHVSSAAARLLADALKTADGLADAVQQRILQGPLPVCLEPLLKRVLLSRFGDLEAVWADAGLKQHLLGLSLEAMQELLSSNELKVASEDTVLYTFIEYVYKVYRLSAEQGMDARRVLAPLIRCPYLSGYWLTITTDPTTRAAWALAELQPQVAKLLVLGSAQPGVPWMHSFGLQRLLPGAPPSWLMGQRISKPVSSVFVTCSVTISILREAAHRCVAEGQALEIFIKQSSTPPLGGLIFTLQLVCSPAAAGAGCEVHMVVTCTNLEAATICPSFNCRLVSPGGHSAAAAKPLGAKFVVFKDFFKLGVMAGGWDAVAVAAKGLPASGELFFTLTVAKVGHMQHVKPAQAPVGQQRQ